MRHDPGSLRWAARLIVVVTMLGGAPAATANGTGAPGSDPLITSGSVVVYDRSRAPAACRPGAVAAKIETLFAVLDHGRTGGPTSLLEREPLFQWYSMTAGKRLEPRWHVVAHTPAEARSLFQRRRQAGERMRLAAASIRFDPRRSLANVEPVYRYRAQDVAGGRPRFGLGKAVFSCRSGQLRVWSGAVDVRAVGPRRSSYCGYTSAQIRRRAETGLGPVICADRLT